MKVSNVQSGLRTRLSGIAARYRDLSAHLVFALLICLSALAQNVSISIDPVNPPIEIPSYGGSFQYDLTLTNDDSTNWVPNVWVTLTTPTGIWEEPIWGMFTAPLHAGQTKTRQPASTELPLRAPAGNYTCTAYVGEYPNSVWDADSIQFEKLEGYEEWVARYDGDGNDDDGAYDLVVDGDGSVVVTGRSWSDDTNFDWVTIKYSASGEILWSTRYNDTADGSDTPMSMVIDEGRNTYITGSGDNDYTTIKYNSEGIEQWVALYSGLGMGSGNDYACSIVIDEERNVFITGVSWGDGTEYDYATIKYSSEGIEQWVVRYDGPGSGWDEANSIALDDAGNVYVTGYSTGINSRSDYTTIKYNSEGIEQWVSHYNGPANMHDYAYSLALDTTGNIFVTGESAGSGTFDDFATIKYNSEGVEQWVARYNGMTNDGDRAYSLCVDPAGNPYVTGTGDHNFATIKYNTAGVELWVAQYDGPGSFNDEATSIGLDDAVSVFVTGFSGNYPSYPDYATVKYNSAGVEQWVARYSGPTGLWDVPNSLAVNNAGSVYVTGYSHGVESVQDYLTIKYTPPLVAGWGGPTETVMGAPLPEESRLLGNYPNPFNPTTVLSYQLQDASKINLSVYDVSGRQVAELVDGWRDAGTHEVTFDGSDLASGVYLYRLTTEEQTVSGKMVLLK